MVSIQNFTEFYNLLKTHPNITREVPLLLDFVFLVERFKNTCSCRNNEKQRLKLECENRYRAIVMSDVARNINLFRRSLNEQNFRFTQNGGMIREF